MGNLVLKQLTSGHHSMPELRAIYLTAGEKLSHGNCASLVYFPMEGLVSVVTTNGAHAIDSSFVGREGFIGLRLAHLHEGGSSSALVRFGGSAIVASSNAFRQALSSSPAMRETIQHYNLLCLEQASQAIFAASRCTVEQRIARWLLMASNRLGSDSFNLTHATLAEALGVRRPGVTVGLHLLEGKHAIKARRRFIEINSRETLIDCAGPAYRDVFYDQTAAAGVEGSGPAAQRPLNEGLSAYL